MVEDIQDNNHEKEANITELKQIQSQLRDSEKKLKRYLILLRIWQC